MKTNGTPMFGLLALFLLGVSVGFAQQGLAQEKPVPGSKHYTLPATKETV